MAAMGAAFAATGPNEAGLVDETKFVAFITEVMNQGAARGNFEDPRPEQRV